MEMRPKIQPASPLVAGLCNGEPLRALTLLFHNSLRHVSMAPSWVSHSLPSHPNLYIYIYIYLVPTASLLCYGILLLPEGGGRGTTSRTSKVSRYYKERERGKMKEEEEDRGRNTKGTGEQVTEIRRFFVARNNWVEGPSGERGRYFIEWTRERVVSGRGSLELHLKCHLKLRLEGSGRMEGDDSRPGTSPGRLRLSLGLCASIL